jgi:SIR2-like domain
MQKSMHFNPDLVEDVAQRRVVLFIGAGASKSSKPNSGRSFLDWTDFLLKANKLVSAKRIKTLIAKSISNKDYLIASELLKENLQEKWKTLLTDEFQQTAPISRLHKALIDLDQRILVTTNFDKLIENAWSASSQRHQNVISKMDDKAFKLFRDDDPYLIKLHGSIDDADQIVFDKSSYQKNAYSNRFYSELIGTLLLTHTFIFVGFSMDDPAISLIIESHAHRFSDTRPHYILLSGKPIKAIDDLSKKLRKLYVLRYSDANNHIALSESLEALAAKASDKRREILAASVVSKS